MRSWGGVRGGRWIAHSWDRLRRGRGSGASWGEGLPRSVHGLSAGHTHDGGEHIVRTASVRRASTGSRGEVGDSRNVLDVGRLVDQSPVKGHGFLGPQHDFDEVAIGSCACGQQADVHHRHFSLFVRELVSGCGSRLLHMLMTRRRVGLGR